MKKICIFAILCCVALPLFAEESVVEWNAELELVTPASENRFEETVGTWEYNWRTTPLAFGRFSGHGIYTKSDTSDEWFMRHTLAYAPMNSAPFLAVALEYGANQERRFSQGGVSFIASRVSNIRERFQYLALSYFSDIRDAPSSSEWMARFQTKEIPLVYSAAVVLEGIYRYRPSEKRERDIGSVELWYGASEELRRYSNNAAFLNFGVSFEKEGVQWIPFLGMRLRF